MSLEKAIASGKEHRKPFIGCKAISRSCRCHGGCPWCLGNRRYRYNKELEKTEKDLKEWRLEK